MQHKAGFVNIVGNPNVGKSTLMNQLVGEQISIATFKAQTTRHRIMGIVNTPEAQVVFSDTPGVLKPNYKMQEMMLAFSESALADADILLYVTDVRETPTKNMDFLEKVSKMEIPVILLINKIDESEQNQLGDLVETWHKLLPKAEILPISAKNKFGTEILMKRILELLPESPAYFDKDQLTDKPAKFFVSEIIREKILRYYDKEIPYSVEVAVERFKEDERLIRINAVIYVERDSQKGIIIGHQGQALKKVSAEARSSSSARRSSWRPTSRSIRTGEAPSASCAFSATTHNKGARAREAHPPGEAASPNAHPYPARQTTDGTNDKKKTALTVCRAYSRHRMARAEEC